MKCDIISNGDLCMPTLYTHYEIGKKVLDKLDDSIKENIQKNINYYYIFNQGFDNLYYYHKHWEYYKNFGIKAHKNNIDIFFKSLIQYIKMNNLDNDYSIIYGFLNHYITDTLLHPYINFQVKNLGIKHSRIEYMLDYALSNYLQNRNLQGHDYKIMLPKIKFTKDLSSLVTYAFKEAYNEDNIGKIMAGSIRNGYYIHRYFVLDNKGIKRHFYKIVDKLVKKDETFSDNTYYITSFDERLLNKEHNKWKHPKKDEEYTYSLEDLFKITIDLCIKMNTLAYDVLHNKKDLEEFLKLIRLIELKNISILLQQ